MVCVESTNKPLSDYEIKSMGKSYSKKLNDHKNMTFIQFSFFSNIEISKLMIEKYCDTFL